MMGRAVYTAYDNTKINKSFQNCESLTSSRPIKTVLYVYTNIIVFHNCLLPVNLTNFYSLYIKMFYIKK